MQQDFVLSANLRDGTGKSVTRKLRAAGTVPAVLYGHGVEKPTNLTVDPKELGKALRTAWGPNVILTLKAGGKDYTVMCRDVQRHPVSRAVRHVDFLAPNPAKEIIVWVPLNITGRSVGVQAGGKLRQPNKEIRIKTIPSKIPADVTVDITNLDIEQSILASNLSLGEGVKVVYDRDFVIAKILSSKGKEGEK